MPLAGLAIAVVLLLAGGEPGSGPAAPTRTAAPPAGASAGGSAASGKVEFPGIRIFPAERRVEVDAVFAVVDESIYLEYAAVAPQGKLHESLLELRCAPEKLQLGLILCGLEPRPEVQYHGEPRELGGPRVAIEVAWPRSLPAGSEAPREQVAPGQARLEDLIVDVRFGRAIERTGFAFTGSRFLPGPPGGPSGPFAATASGSGIALYHDPDAILDNPLVSGGDVPLLAPTFRMVEVVGWVPGDERYRPAAAKLPPSGTPATLTLRPQ